MNRRWSERGREALPDGLSAVLWAGDGLIAYGSGSDQTLDTPSAMAPMQSHIDSIAQARVIGDFALLASAKRAILQRPALGYSAAGTTKNHGRISR